ncbi:hypothetical protein MIMGU_mgv11b017415mg [Erythranthe guttata]|uniref:Uncharacterized protein n=1 Tax=Erythranthe guttata TaxID=4155 RepID=A0A022Q6C3_ERYGU|nr:hypothetical protein MIMGU_mgv11b017415mg [Erythranthe guttata]
MHANGLYADKLAPSKLQTLITFDSGGVTTQSAYAREARSDAVVVLIGRSPIDPTLEVKIVRLARSRAVSDANGTFIGEIRAFSIDLPPQNFSARSVRALDFARQMHGHAQLRSSDGIRCISAGMIAPHAQLRSSDEIRCISAGMIAPVSLLHANGLYADKLEPWKLQTLITFDSGGVTTQSAYAREARSDAVVVSIGRSPIDPTLEVRIVRLLRSRAVSHANGTFIGEIRAFSIDLPPQKFSARSVRALDFARQMHGVWERFWRNKK